MAQQPVETSPNAVGEGHGPMLTSPAQGPAEAATTVLFLEGSLASFALVEAVLARLPQVRVVPIMQGRLGLALALSEQPALILVDLELPDLPGTAVVRALQGDRRTRSIPVITVGSAKTASLAAHLQELGARAHVTQPLNVSQFLALVQDVLAGNEALQRIPR